MQYYEQLLAHLQQNDPAQAELLEEEVNIMIHKLKFLPKESFPSVTVLEQDRDFGHASSDSLEAKVTIAGGRIAAPGAEPQVSVILKSDDSLYSKLPELLQREWLHNSPAYRDNRIFIIDAPEFGNDATFIRDTEVLAEVLQPKYFYFGHEGGEWIKFDLVHS